MVDFDSPWFPYEPYEIPLLWTVKILPVEEEGDARNLLSAVMQLQQFSRDFDMAVKLYKVSEHNIAQQHANRKSLIQSRGLDPDTKSERASYDDAARMFQSWQRIAARDGAIQIYHMGAVMKSIGEHLITTPSLMGLINHKRRREAFKLLSTSFPNYELIRNAVAHSIYEVAPTQARMKKHSVTHVDIPGAIKIEKGDDSAGNADRTVIISDSLCDNLYTVTFKNQVASYEVSEASSAKLLEVHRTFFSAFHPLMDRWNESRRKPDGSPLRDSPR